MNLRILLIAALTAALSAVPLLYLRLVWPAVPALVPTHYGPGGPDHFTARAVLWDLAWWPVIAWVVLTFWPQVHDGQPPFWSSPRQRQLRAVVVAALAACVVAGVHKSISYVKSAEPAKATHSTTNQPGS